MVSNLEQNLKYNPKVLGFVLGGGKGKRLYPLTAETAKPDISLGGTVRFIDFVLNNFYHSGIRKIRVITQFQSRNLHRHLESAWYPKFGIGVDENIRTLPSILTLTDTSGWAEGTAEAITNNIEEIERETPDIVNIFAGDHIYLMDISQMNDFHIQTKADLTISAIPVKRELAARNYGVLKINSNQELVDFEEKPENPSPMPNNPNYCLASMGNYSFNPEVLMFYLQEDDSKEFTNDPKAIVENPEHFTKHDFGLDIIPSMLREKKRIMVYNFAENSIRGSKIKKPYWRDVGDLDQLYEANMEIRSKNPPIDLYNLDWQVLTHTKVSQPAHTIGTGKALESIISNGVIISNALVERCVLSYSVTVGDGSVLEDSIFLGDNHIGKNVKIVKTIVDEGVSIPNKEIIGFDQKKDKERGFTISQKGITIVPRNYQF